MNKKGSLFFGITLFFLVFISGVLIIPFFTDDITIARTNLNCVNTTITDGTKLTCLFHDAFIPYFFWFFCSLALSILFGGMK